MGGRTRRRIAAFKHLWVLGGFLSVALVAGSCGPDRQFESLGPNADLINQPLAANPVALQLTSTDGNAGASCSNNLDLLVNPENLRKIADGFELNGSIFSNSPAFGALRFGNGRFQIKVDPTNPSQIISLTGDGAALLPAVGILSAFDISNPLRVSIAISKGSELQDEEIPVADDNTCYFVFRVLPQSQPLSGIGANFNFSIGPGALVLMDPMDPLVFFTGSMENPPGADGGDGGKDASGNHKSSGKGLVLKNVAIGISAGGNLVSTAKAIPGKIISGHLFFGATFDIPETPFTVSGNVFLRFPDFNDINSRLVLSVDGSLFISGNAVSDLVSASGVLPSFSDDTLHLGDGTVIQAFGFTATGGRVAVRPTYRNDFGLQSADVMGNAVAAAELDGVLDATSTVSILGYLDLDQDPGAFSFAFNANMRLSVTAINLQLQVSMLATNRQLADSHFRLTGLVKAGPLDFNVLVNVGVGGFLATANLSFGFNLAVVYGGLDAALTIGFPTPGIITNGMVDLCFANPFGADPCAGLGVVLQIGATTSVCVDTTLIVEVFLRVNPGPSFSGGLGGC